MTARGRGVRIGDLDRIRPALSPLAKRPAVRSSERAMWRGMGEAWNALSTLVAGIAVWGAIGYVIDLLVGTRPVLFVFGVLLGNFAGIYLVYVKYFKQDESSGSPFLDGQVATRPEEVSPDAS